MNMAKLKRILVLGLVPIFIILFGCLIQGCNYNYSKTELRVKKTSAEVIRYDPELNVLLIRNQHNYVLEVQISDELAVVDRNGTKISVSDLLPGQQVQISYESRLHSLESEIPLSSEAASTLLYCIMIEIL